MFFFPILNLVSKKKKIFTILRAHFSQIFMSYSSILNVVSKITKKRSSFLSEDVFPNLPVASKGKSSNKGGGAVFGEGAHLRGEPGGKCPPCPPVSYATAADSTCSLPIRLLTAFFFKHLYLKQLSLKLLFHFCLDILVPLVVISSDCLGVPPKLQHQLLSRSVARLALRRFRNN